MIVQAAYGGGTNSTAMLIGMVERGERVDVVLFADTGDEKPNTYEHNERFSRWLVEHGRPPITVVRNRLPQGVIDGSLGQECYRLGTMPSKAFGYGSCSIKWKQKPQDDFMSTFAPAVASWALGERVTKLVGYDADEPHRALKLEAYNNVDKLWFRRCPLIEWDWGRDECIEAISRAGLPLPGKSACFYCPSSKQPEIIELSRAYPRLAARALEIERRALAGEGGGKAEIGPNVKGLGRRFAWKDVLAGFTYEEPSIEMDCGCYDGE